MITYPRWRVTCAAGLSILLPAAASAQPRVATAPRTDDGAYVHAGPYVRATLSAGGLTGTFDDDNARFDLEFDGRAIGFDAHVGGALVPGFVLGFMLSHVVAPNVQYVREGLDDQGGGPVGEGSVSLTQLAVFLDGFPWPRAGLHWGVALGYTRIGLEDIVLVYQDDRATDVSASGPSLALWAGYDFWLAEDWSIGPMLRAQGAFFAKAGAHTASVSVLTLGVSGLYQ